jgi:hypothetical protein
MGKLWDKIFKLQDKDGLSKEDKKLKRILEARYNKAKAKYKKIDDEEKAKQKEFERRLASDSEYAEHMSKSKEFTAKLKDDLKKKKEIEEQKKNKVLEKLKGILR